MKVTKITFTLALLIFIVQTADITNNTSSVTVIPDHDHD